MTLVMATRRVAARPLAWLSIMATLAETGLVSAKAGDTVIRRTAQIALRAVNGACKSGSGLLLCSIGQRRRALASLM
jgi:hypothetical protein